MDMKAGNENNGSGAPAATIMVVEDESIVAKDIETSLRALGYKVAGVMSSGEEAIPAAKAARPDLILMDIMLRGKLDGVETAHRITSEMNIPVVFLTAYSDESTIGRAKKTNAAGYLLKPFEERELRTTIEMALYKHAMELKLMRNREWLKTILHSIADAVLTTNETGLIEFVNPAAETLTGFTAPEMIAHRLSDVVRLQKAKDTIRLELNPELFLHNNGGIALSESDIVLVAKDGRQNEVEYSAAPLKYSDGKTVGVVVVLRDISAKQKGAEREKALQRRLFRAHRMESLGMLASGVAEQLHRMIGPIIEYPNLILNKVAPDNEIKQDLAVIRNSAQKADEILGDLLALGRLENYSLEPLRLDEVVVDLINSPAFKLKRQNAPLVDFQIELPEQIPPVIGSKQSLLELTANLVLHAYAFVGDSGTIKLSLEFVKVNETILGFEIVEAGEYVALKVADSGRSLSEEEINRFFEPFYAKNQAADHQSHNALGMALAYAIIKGHKGMIDIKSAPGKGNEITIYFPAQTIAAVADRQPENYDVQGVETVLIVDDDDALRKSASSYLRSIGYKTTAARNGSEAIAVAKNIAETKGPPIDLLVLDMITADACDGLDTFKTILQFNPRQKAIIVSGFSMTDRIKQAMQLGAGQCLLKPYEHEELARAVRKELDKPFRQVSSARE